MSSGLIPAKNKPSKPSPNLVLDSNKSGSFAPVCKSRTGRRGRSGEYSSSNSNGVAVLMVTSLRSASVLDSSELDLLMVSLTNSSVAS
ncbi:hypothetical protein WICPIJ_001799 [Wickerhamomyces pijperi]|uniref:Uncharacterized protein n=1 Tax=Wickerhamomyces pijperi TaxID=599730 RepID=A0A9P8QD21_WICPI|nr:hypothetical protein WICPIJ_001799 [Wickerhamomyces pijperi]